MVRKLIFIAFVSLLVAGAALAQTTAGSITGLIKDPSGAVVPGARVEAINQRTGERRSTITDEAGEYLILELPPSIYDITVTKPGFATEKHPNVELLVNQSDRVDFTLTVSAKSEMITVTGAPPLLNTTSATLSDVIQHQAIVDLPLNGREFTQLTQLSPGVSPFETSQQGAFTVALGAGGISPSVDGQRGEMNNFTMDGVLNNQTFTNIWAISPPPDALQEFAVQAHITNAQFAVTSGANINIVTRSGTNQFHGSIWEFWRNTDLDSRDFFETNGLPYNQNQYGLYVGGPVLLPHFNGRNNTWFSGYWEGFRNAQTLPYFGTTLTAAERTGDFSAQLGPQIGTDDLGRPEYQEEIYDPLTTRPDPIVPGAYIRDPFPNNIIPADRINSVIPLYIAKYYPLPNLNVAPMAQPNFKFAGTSATRSDQFGIRLDHRFDENDLLFARYNRNAEYYQTPEPLPGYSHFLNTPATQVAVGYTHIFGPKSILNFRYGFTGTDITDADQGAGTAFTSSVDYTLTNMNGSGPTNYGPQIEISNGYSSVDQIGYILGPEEGSDVHLDYSQTIRHHTIEVGGMFYHVFATGGTYYGFPIFNQGPTTVDGAFGLTGNGAASFMLGTPGYLTGYAGLDFETNTTNWYGGYAQDTWRILPNLTIHYGLRYDYLGPTNLHNPVITGLDVYTGQFLHTAPLPLANISGENVPRNYFYTQHNGYEPRFGVAYQPVHNTVVRAGFAVLDDHNNPLVQEHGDYANSWPDNATISAFYNDDLAVQPTVPVYINALPPNSSFLNPSTPYVGASANPDLKVPYSIECQAGIEQQLVKSSVLYIDYVGSQTRHNYTNMTANTAPTPGSGSLTAREPFPQYGGGVISWTDDNTNANYNSLQVELKGSLPSVPVYEASYTWSKSMDIESDPYDEVPQDFYNLGGDYGPSDFNFGQMFVLSGVYAIPVGAGRHYLASGNRVLQGVLGGWNVGSIFSMHSGQVTECQAGGDIANVGGGLQRCDQVPGVSPYSAFNKSTLQWLNPVAFTIEEFTFGTESRNNLHGPSYVDWDANIFKDFSIYDRMKLEFRAEGFNVLNHTNFYAPVSNVQSAAFGGIFGSDSARELQLAAKIVF